MSYQGLTKPNAHVHLPQFAVLNNFTIKWTSNYFVMNQFKFKVNQVRPHQESRVKVKQI